MIIWVAVLRLGSDSFRAGTRLFGWQFLDLDETFWMAVLGLGQQHLGGIFTAGMILFGW